MDKELNPAGTGRAAKERYIEQCDLAHNADLRREMKTQLQTDIDEDWAYEEADIYAAELVGPNSPEYEDCAERRYEELVSARNQS